MTAPPPQNFDASEFVDVLTKAGVTVVDKADGTVVAEAEAPVGPLVMTEAEAASLARETSVGAGILGASLDGLIDEPIPDVPISGLLAGYLLSANTPGGVWSAELIGSFDPERVAEVEFPAAVLALFVAEAVRPTEVSAEAAAVGRGVAAGVLLPNESAALARPAVLAQDGDPCAPFTVVARAMVEQVLDFAAVNAFGWLPEWVTKWGVDYTKAYLESEWPLFVPSVTSALLVLVVLSSVSALVGSWSMSITPSNSSDRFSVGSEGPRNQVFTANVGGIEFWPSGLDECAASLGITLPDPTGAGTPATWSVSGFPQYGEEDSRQASFDAQGLARLHWHTGHEESDTGTEQIGIVTAMIQPDPEFRESLVQTAQAALKQLLGQVGPLAAGVGIVLPDATAMFTAVSELLVQNASAKVEVLYHAEEGCRTGKWFSTAFAAPDQVIAGGIGAMTIEFTDENTATVTLDPEYEIFTRIAVEGAPVTKLELKGQYSFTIGESDAVAHTGGNAYVTAFADLNGEWVQASEPIRIVGGFGAVNDASFECSEDLLIIRSEGVETRFRRVGLGG